MNTDQYLGCTCGVEGLIAVNDKLNAQVVEQVINTQELVMMNDFALEANEYQFKKCMEQRIAEITSWRWVLQDLAKRLEEAINTLRYEHKALRVVIRRLHEEIDLHSVEGTRPGALAPHTDVVEDAINEEHKFLTDQKKKFELLIPILEEVIKTIEKTKNIIEEDISSKDKAIIVEESCSSLNTHSDLKHMKRKKRCKCKPLPRWESRCVSLKQAGLAGLRNAVVSRQQVRGARAELSVTAQAYSARVDSALRRRLHANRAKVNELQWHKEEALQDLKALENELTITEKSLLDNMEREKVVKARLADRTFRPPREMTRDEVNQKLKYELARIRKFIDSLRKNIYRIKSLHHNLTSTVTKIDGYIADINNVIQLDEERINFRLGDSDSGNNRPPEKSSSLPKFPSSTSNNKPVPTTPPNSESSALSTINTISADSSTLRSIISDLPINSQLNTIMEDGEDEDDYPFTY